MLDDAIATSELDPFDGGCPADIMKSARQETGTIEIVRAQNEQLRAVIQRTTQEIEALIKRFIPVDLLEKQEAR